MSLLNMIEKKLVSCEPSESIQAVAKMMEKEDVGAVLVLKDGRPEGIITDRDLAIRCVAEGMDCSGKKAQDIMSKKVKTVEADAGIKDAIDAMGHSKVRRVVMVDEDGKATGLLSFGDVLDLLAEEIVALRETVHPAKFKIVKQAA